MQQSPKPGKCATNKEGKDQGRPKHPSINVKIKSTMTVNRTKEGHDIAYQVMIHKGAEKA